MLARCCDVDHETGPTCAVVPGQFARQFGTRGEPRNVGGLAVVAVFDDRDDVRIGGGQRNAATGLGLHQRNTDVRPVGGIVAAPADHGTESGCVRPDLETVGASTDSSGGSPWLPDQSTGNTHSG